MKLFIFYEGPSKAAGSALGPLRSWRLLPRDERALHVGHTRRVPRGAGCPVDDVTLVANFLSPGPASSVPFSLCLAALLALILPEKGAGSHR